MLSTLKIASVAALLTLGLAVTQTASADPILWTLDSTALAFGGGFVSGSFVYDADTNAFTSINLTVTTDGPLGPVDGIQATIPADIYTGGLQGDSGPNLLDLLDPSNGTGGSELELIFDAGSALTNAGGTVATGIRLEDITTGYTDHDSGGATYNTSVSGVETTPEPDSVVLLGLGLVAVGLITKRRLTA